MKFVCSINSGIYIALFYECKMFSAIYIVHNNIKKEDKEMEKWVCTACGYVYDPEAGDPDSGVAAGTAFEDIPEDWVCPLCGVGKDMFEKQ